MKKSLAASEADVAILHSIATKLYTIKANSILARAEELDLMDATEVIDTKEVEKIAKWALDNGITLVDAATDEKSELAKSLAAIREKQKGKIISFTGTDD